MGPKSVFICLASELPINQISRTWMNEIYAQILHKNEISDIFKAETQILDF